MTNYAYIATSLDGFIATPDGGIEWLTSIQSPEGEDYGYAQFMDSIDAIVMGRKTYETVLAFPEWPYQKPVIVLSSTLTKLQTDKAILMIGEPQDITQKLHERGYSNLYIDGGKTIQRFIEAKQLHEMTITRIPILLGDGISLFGEHREQHPVEHVQTTTYPNGLVKSTYRFI